MLVIAPITALVREQVQKMNKLGVNAALLENNTYAEVTKMDEVQILYCNPECLFGGQECKITTDMQSLFLRHESSEKEISLIAVDEAHKII